tara:strand:+ start:5101 stop:5610 length:510 start_codon:yes stop_codon:yes gene_type:complete
MVSDRISLINIYDALLLIDQSDGKIDSIRLNRKNDYGTKSIPVFNSLKEFKLFIDDLYPYKEPNIYTCLTKNEGIYNLLSFSFKKGKDTIFINNLETAFKTANPSKINKFNFDNLQKLNKLAKSLSKLLKEYVCYPYIELGYFDIRYVEIINNIDYLNMIDLYKKTKQK